MLWQYVAETQAYVSMLIPLIKGTWSSERCKNVNSYTYVHCLPIEEIHLHCMSAVAVGVVMVPIMHFCSQDLLRGFCISSFYESCQSN